MYADFKLKFNLQCLLFEHFRYDHSSVLIQPPRSHRLDPARPMSMHGPLHGCSTRPNLEAGFKRMIRVSGCPLQNDERLEWLSVSPTKFPTKCRIPWTSLSSRKGPYQIMIEPDHQITSPRIRYSDTLLTKQEVVCIHSRWCDHAQGITRALWR